MVEEIQQLSHRVKGETHVGAGLGGTAHTLPTSGQSWFEGWLWLTISFKCRTISFMQKQGDGSHTTLGHCPRPPSCKQTLTVLSALKYIHRLEKHDCE